MRGGGRFGPLAICQTTGLTVNLITAFDSSGLELSEYVAKVYLKVTDDVTGRVKGQIFFTITTGFFGQSNRF